MTHWTLKDGNQSGTWGTVSDAPGGPPVTKTQRRGPVNGDPAVNARK